jgi:hypothetical protein
METPPDQRWKIFGVGFAGGLVLAAIIFWHHGWPRRAAGPEPGTIRHLTPGALIEWTSTGQPIEGDFVLSQTLSPAAPDGTRTRGVVVPGLDAGSYVRIEETWAPETPGAAPTVRAWKFMFADHVRVKLQRGADSQALAAALHTRGWRFTARDVASGWITVGLGVHVANAVPTALAQLRAWPQWVAQAEPDTLPPPAMGPATL